MLWNSDNGNVMSTGDGPLALTARKWKYSNFRQTGTLNTDSVQISHNFGQKTGPKFTPELVNKQASSRATVKEHSSRSFSVTSLVRSDNSWLRNRNTFCYSENELIRKRVTARTSWIIKWRTWYSPPCGQIPSFFQRGRSDRKQRILLQKLRGRSRTN